MYSFDPESLLRLEEAAKLLQIEIIDLLQQISKGTVNAYVPADTADLWYRVHPKAILKALNEDTETFYLAYFSEPDSSKFHETSKQLSFKALRIFRSAAVGPSLSKDFTYAIIDGRKIEIVNPDLRTFLSILSKTTNAVTAAHVLKELDWDKGIDIGKRFARNRANRLIFKTFVDRPSKGFYKIKPFKYSA